MDTISADKIANSAGVVGAIAVASTADVYTHSHSIKDASNLVLFYKATGTSPDIDIYLQQGPGAPTTEGSAGDSTDGWINIGSKIADVTDESWHYVVISPVVMPFIRFLLDGQGSNPANCVIDLRLGKQSALGV